MRFISMACGLFALGLAQGAFASELAVKSSLHPAPRPSVNSMITQVAAHMTDTNDAAFRQWIGAFRHRALAAGISARTFDAAFRSVQLNPDVVARDRNQSEFTKTIWDYLDSAASDQRVADGQAAMRKYGHLLDEIEARYGVDKKIIVAIWGMESRYGAHRGDVPIIGAMATLAFEGRRSKFFEGQLIDALKIIQHGDVSADHMTGSWAGAMGHTQFIPSSYLLYAVDFSGDGKRDIWSDDPTDALASTAAYLAKSGWKHGQPWGIEVTLPRGFNYTETGHHVQRSVREWAALGVRAANGGALRDYGTAEILLPAGARGAAFMIFSNFRAIMHYNAADAYVLGVGILGDRIAGGPPLRASWPRDDRALTFDERVMMQTKLTQAGFDTQGTDGNIGPNTTNAIRSFQRSIGMVPDGYASIEILKHLQ